MKRVYVLSAALAANLLAGCGSETENRRHLQEHSPVVVDSAIIDGLSTADCDVLAPSEAADQAPMVLRGTVGEITPGPDSVRPYLKERFERERSVVFEVEVTEVLKGGHLLGADDRRAYVAVGRGGGVVDASGDSSGGDASRPVEYFRRAVPRGTRVLVYTAPFRWVGEGGATVVDRDAGRPTGAPLFGSYTNCGRGLNFDAGPERLGYWGMTFAELERSVSRWQEGQLGGADPSDTPVRSE